MGPTTDFRVSITDPAGTDAYPIASFTWLLVRKSYPDAAKARELVKFIWWSLNDGQAQAPRLGYAPLPKAMVPWIEARLKTISADGKAVWAGPSR
jgi:phosphate transport system substrate-binding protein